MVFTDGFVMNGRFRGMWMMCMQSPIIPRRMTLREKTNQRTFKRGKPVGMNVDNVDCEFHGVILALQTTVDLDSKIQRFKIYSLQKTVYNNKFTITTW